jgi:deoxyribodipyrimidine photo-lyase
MKPTTHLSTYNKFGTVSIREVFHSITKEVGGGPAHPLTQQLYWRDFLYGVSYCNPHVFNGQAIKKELNDIPWENNWKWFEKWKEGKIGCPIFDAGMKQLYCTGYLPNRMRLVVASFLTKDLIIDWRWGEKYFAAKLVDYDPSQNNGGWQWVAGSDSQPDHRVFNPKLQIEKFDKQCEFILKWVQ